MRIDKVFNYFEPLGLSDELMKFKFELYFQNDKYHAFNENRAWYWLEKDNYESCKNNPTEKISLSLTPDISHELCDDCLTIGNLIGSISDESSQQLPGIKDIFTAYLSLSSMPLKYDVEKIYSETKSLKAYYDLAHEYFRAVDEIFDDGVQSYFILSDFSKSLAEKLVSQQVKLFEKAHEETIRNSKADSMLKSYINKYNLLPGFNLDGDIDEREICSATITGYQAGESPFNESTEKVILEEGGLSQPDLAWLALAIYAPKAMNSTALVDIPYWVYELAKKYSQEAVTSEPYFNLNSDPAVLEIAKVLWEPYGNNIYSSFDLSIKAAKELQK